MIEYKVIPTKIGKNKIAELTNQNKSLNLQSFKIGSNKPEKLTEAKEDIQNKVYVSGINKIEVNENKIDILCIVPAKYGDFYMGEIGIYDSENNLIFYGNIPYQFKPTAESGGTDVHIPIEIAISTKNLKVELDPSKSLAMKSDLDEIRELIDDIDIPEVFHNAPMNAVTEDMVPSDFEYGVTICNQGQVNTFPTIKEYGVSITIRGVHASYAQIFITRFGDMWSRRSGVINEWNGEWYNSKKEIDTKADKRIIGDLTELETNNKENLVKAINEVKLSSGGSKPRASEYFEAEKDTSKTGYVVDIVGGGSIDTILFFMTNPTSDLLGLPKKLKIIIDNEEFILTHKNDTKYGYRDVAGIFNLHYYTQRSLDFNPTTDFWISSLLRDEQYNISDIFDLESIYENTEGRFTNRFKVNFNIPIFFESRFSIEILEKGHKNSRMFVLGGVYVD